MPKSKYIICPPSFIQEEAHTKTRPVCMSTYKLANGWSKTKLKNLQKNRYAYKSVTLFHGGGDKIYNNFVTKGGTY